MSPLHPGPGRFATTRWSLVVAAGQPSDAGRRALAELCELYWPPVYAFLRCKSGDAELAADLTQGFFADLLAREDIDKADPARGRFRSFLLKSAQNFAAKDHARQHAQKRGGHLAVVSLEALRGEHGEAFAIADTSTPEAVFERRWATALLARVTEQLAAQYAARGRAAVFAALQGYLEQVGEPDSYAEVAARLAAQQIVMSESAIRVTVHRMRQRFRELLIGEVSQTIGADVDAMDEIAALREALRDDRRNLRP